MELRGHAGPRGLKQPAPSSDGSWRPVEAARGEAPDLVVVEGLGKGHYRQPLAQHRGAADLERMTGRRAAAGRTVTGSFAIRRVCIVLGGCNEIRSTVVGRRGSVLVGVAQSLVRLSSGRGLMAVSDHGSRSRHGDREDRNADREQSR